MTTQDRTDQDKQDAFERLMDLGNQAKAQGDKVSAHRRWRRAAVLQPDNEAVWLALYSVLDREEDRRTCLHNILAINPQNFYAQEALASLSTDEQPDLPASEGMNGPKQRSVSRWFGLGLIFIEALIVLAFIALAILLISNI